MKYTAIIGDIKGSRNLNERNKVQRDLRLILNQINTKYDNELASGFLITLGDEFQGLLESPRHVLEIIKLIQKRMYPVEIRFGIGIGELLTDIDKKAAIGSDGPAFYAAREMVEDLRKKESKNKTFESDIQLTVYGEDLFEIEQINTLLCLTKMIEDKWKYEQRITIWNMIEMGGSQEECAKRLSTTQSTVGRRLSTGNYYLYVKTLDVISRSISRLEVNE